jgi:hypothetical protein
MSKPTLNHSEAIRKLWEQKFNALEIMIAMKDAGYWQHRKKNDGQILWFIRQRIREFEAQAASTPTVRVNPEEKKCPSNVTLRVDRLVHLSEQLSKKKVSGSL